MHKAIWVLVLGTMCGFAWFYWHQLSVSTSPPAPREKKFDIYTYTALKHTSFTGSTITIDKVLKDTKTYTSYLFFYTVGGKRVSGLINVPKAAGVYPAIIMIRGYVDPAVYVTGMGTSHGGELMAENGFITLAPDFLGYGSSDKPSPDAMEDRFLTYTTTLTLMHSLPNLNAALERASLPARFDATNIGMWGHSNGGQIVLSVMEISGASYPTVLWAPVSKPFPYSILYYTDDIEDHGKALRKVVATFEKDYNAEDYSLTNYFNWIKAPLEIHQGGSDTEVPLLWSNTLVATLKAKQKDITYYTYPAEDHNFDQGSWPTVMQHTMAFYTTHFAPKTPTQ